MGTLETNCQNCLMEGKVFTFYAFSSFKTSFAVIASVVFSSLRQGGKCWFPYMQQSSSPKGLEKRKERQLQPKFFFLLTYCHKHQQSRFFKKSKKAFPTHILVRSSSWKQWKECVNNNNTFILIPLVNSFKLSQETLLRVSHKRNRLQIITIDAD